MAVKMLRRSLMSRVSSQVRPAEALPADTRLGAQTARMLSGAVNLDIEPQTTPAVTVGSSFLNTVSAQLHTFTTVDERDDAVPLLLEPTRHHVQTHQGDINLGVDMLARTRGVSSRVFHRSRKAPKSPRHRAIELRIAGTSA